MLQGHGDDGYSYSRNIIADFSTNVWYGGEPAKLKDHLFNRWDIIKRYPEVVAESLSKKIGTHHKLEPENILINNGTAESIYLVAQAFNNSSSTILHPSFSEYEDACRLFNHRLEFLSWEQLNPDYKLQTDLFFICNPNNPTGSVFFDLEKLIEKNPDTVFIVDEAFIDFTLSIKSSIPLIKKFSNLVILHSLTKAFAIPGLRLGYIAAQNVIIQKLKANKIPWSVNAMALESGHFIFDNFHTIQLPLQELLEEKEIFTAKLKAFPLTIFESNTHFFLAQSLTGTAAELKDYLVRNFGILIRNASNFRGLTKNHFRLATLSREKNQLLIEALEEWNNR